MKYCMALDPSGAFFEGKGTTGVCFFEMDSKKIQWVEEIRAKDFLGMEEYWDAHCQLILDTLRHYKLPRSELTIVIEDYLLYANKAEEQTNSRMETPKLIGVLQHFCWKEGIPYFMQAAARVVKRWSDEVLIHKGYLKAKGKSAVLSDGSYINKHKRDAIRHAIHYATFRNKGGSGVHEQRNN